MNSNQTWLLTAIIGWIKSSETRMRGVKSPPPEGNVSRPSTLVSGDFLLGGLMSIKVMSHVWKNSKQKGTKLLVLLALADFSNDEGISWPSMKTLAKKARTSKRNTQDIIRKLVEEREIELQEGEGPSGVHLYTVIMGGEEISPPSIGDEELRVDRVKPTSRGDEAKFMGGMKSSSSKPSFNHHINHQKETSVRRSNERTPSIELFYRISERYPPKKLHGTINRIVGNDFGTLLRWGRIIRKWIASGYNPTNYDGMLDVFKNGWNHQHKKDSDELTSEELWKKYAEPWIK